MGICCQTKNAASQPDYLEFNQKANLKIIQRDRKGNYKGHFSISFQLPPPIDQLYSIFSIGKNKYRASGCVIQGADPHGEYIKDCQDTYIFTVMNSIFFAVLFDGHGKEGRKVSVFCRDFMMNYFSENVEKFEGKPIGSIETLVKLCDEELNRCGIDCSLSGSTAVIIVINTSGIHVGSLGDSRAVLATIPKDGIALPPLISMPYRRPIAPSRLLNAVALTTDQKPNHEEELNRIRKAGGVVERVTNHMGHPIGPYRVWKKRGNFPGLAMSRSIGDKVAHDIGVISVPIVNSFEFYPEYDQFIVVGSDGIWDAMDNFDVVNLVEKFRNNSKNCGSSYPARISNSSIARILCEEARYRWLGIIEEEDVTIDDISCIVIEMNSIEPKIPTPDVAIPDRQINKLKSIIVNNSFNIEDTIASRKDLARGSIIEMNGYEVIEE